MIFNHKNGNIFVKVNKSEQIHHKFKGELQYKEETKG